MSVITMTDEIEEPKLGNPGLQLARIREQKGISREYVASKLHLRVKVIESLENDDYLNMPGPVFIKGYLRAYAKLLEVQPEPLLALFNEHYLPEKPIEKALWQSRREANYGRNWVRWVTILIIVAAVIAAGLWWHNNDNPLFFSAIKSTELDSTPVKEGESQKPLSSLSKIQSMFAPAEDEQGGEPPSE